MDAVEAVEALLAAALPVAEAMVKEDGRVRPFGATLGPHGVELAAADERDDARVLAGITAMFQEAARDDACEAVGLFLEAVVRRDRGGPRRALQAAIEHRDGSALDVFRPFEATGEGFAWGDPLRTPRNPSVFPAPPRTGPEVDP